jgi:two-component system, NtrC family, nitrogen regulation sensor histidine kinase NtrY
MKNKTAPSKGISPGLRNMLIALGLFALTLGATAVEIAIKSHKERPLFGNVVALALLNINVLLLAVLVLLIGRHLVKLYIERKASPFGAGYKTKLTTAFAALSIVPAGILFIVAIQLLMGGVKYWFGPKVEGTIKDSLALVESYKAARSADAAHFAEVSAERLGEVQGRLNTASMTASLQAALSEYGLDVLEVYSPDGTRLASASAGDLSWQGPGEAFVKSVLAMGGGTGFTTTDNGELIYAGYPYSIRGPTGKGVVLAGYWTDAGVAGNISNITQFYNEYWNLRAFKNPLKESYALSLVMFMLVVVFAAIWFGLYLSKDITVPITSLAEAADRISKGDYGFVIDVQAHDEVGVLVDSFKRMTMDLKTSQGRLSEANRTLSAANALIEQRRRFIETVLESINTGVITIDRAGKLSIVNRAAGRIMGLDTEAIIGKPYRDIFEFHQLEDIREEIALLADTGDDRGIEKEVQLTINRRTLHLRLFLSALTDPDAGYLGILVVFDDLTELIKAQRASAWQEVARRIAHEVKNPLTPIQLSAQRLRKRFLEGGGSYESIIDECTSTIITQVESMKELVDEFSEFARMPEPKPVACDLHQIIDEAAALYLGAHKDLEVIKEYDPALPEVRLDAQQIKRALINLLENAVTAMDFRGKLWLMTTYVPATSSVILEVADEGTGILPEDRARLFQPYFSKKKAGTGLGLAIVNRIISDHGGTIRVEGNRPKGTRFVIELPVSLSVQPEKPGDPAV